ncbi:hypothetical protein GCM10009038_32170 [Salinicola rhizosphaerae]|uniref:Uncharacterized protein n=1 Tax=Salinicola rhizosphaerae TaxID=1443141 RepID=A0ABQ3E9P2_9GAMM|nr:hypothetical protein GCM10009038_32170 [Salinicola rhizosphaerae]
MRQQLTAELVIEPVTGLVAAKLADQAVSELVQIPDGIEHLVFHELVFVAQAILVNDAVIIYHDGIVETATQRQILRSKELQITHEAESPRSRNFLDE